MYVGIDPSSKTGIVGMDKMGNVTFTKEVSTEALGVVRLVELVQAIIGYVSKGDIVCIEGFSFGSKGRGIDFQYGLGWALRMKMFSSNIPYFEATPTQVKKYATGKGNTKKDNMVLPIHKTWGFEHDSDNVRDAFVLAQIARGVHTGDTKTMYQKEIVELIQKVVSLQNH